MDVEVRRIRPDEWPRQRALRLRALADAPMAFGSTLADESAFADEIWVRRAAAGAAGRERVTFAAEREQRWVGLATGLAAAPERPAPEVVGMFVEPGARGCGVVEALLDAIVGWARDGGGARLCLWVTSTNTAAIRAYTRYGFRLTGETQPLAHTPSVTEVRMVYDRVAEAPSIRLATAADAPHIARLQVRAWQMAYRGLLPDAMLTRLSVERREHAWRHWNDGHPLRRIWVAEQSPALVGFVATGPGRDDDAPAATGEVYAIYIEPHLVGTGLGRRLFAHAVCALRAQDFARATLWVLEGNTRTRRFYEAAGWCADGARKTLPSDGGEPVEVRYARTLTRRAGPS